MMGGLIVRIIARLRHGWTVLRLLACGAALRLRLPVPDEQGQGMLEYAIISGIIIVGAVATLVALSGALNKMFTQITNTLSQY